jgi:hypothetical protein
LRNENQNNRTSESREQQQTKKAEYRKQTAEKPKTRNQKLFRWLEAEAPNYELRTRNYEL